MIRYPLIPSRWTRRSAAKFDSALAFDLGRITGMSEALSKFHVDRPAQTYFTIRDHRDKIATPPQSPSASKPKTH